MNILEAIDDPRLFGGLFKDPSTWAAWRTFLRALFGLPAGAEDLRLFEACTGLDEFPGEQAREAFVIAGRRSGKSFISALIAVYLALFVKWKPHLSPGERGHIFVVAVDREQARIVKNYVSGILGSSPYFRSMVVTDGKEWIDLANGVTISVKTCSFRSIRGYTILGAICEELAFWRSEETGANPAEEVLSALRPALATVPGSLLLGISTPYSRQGLLWDVYRRNFGKPGGPLVWRADTLTMNAAINKETIERALAEDPQAARAEWLAEWRTDVESFIPAEVIERCVVPGRRELLPVAGTKYTAFIDPSGGRADSFTLAISHFDTRTGIVVLDCLRERRPPFSPRDVVEEFGGVIRSYGMRQVVSDRYAGEWPVEAFKVQGILVKPADMTASELYLEALPLFTAGGVELLDDERLAGQLRNLERRTRAGGRDLVAHPSGVHDDAANAACGAVVLAAKTKSQRLGRIFCLGIPCPEEDAQLKSTYADTEKKLRAESPRWPAVGRVWIQSSKRGGHPWLKSSSGS